MLWGRRFVGVSIVGAVCGCSLLTDFDALSAGDGAELTADAGADVDVAKDVAEPEASDVPEPDAGCEFDADPRSAPCQVDEALGWFVSPSGDDNAVGSRGRPFRTIGRALEAVDGTHTRVFVCEGQYAEHVEPTRRVGIYGGFSCTDWMHRDAPTRVTAPTGATALTVVRSGAQVMVQDLELRAPAATDEGASSIAAFVVESVDVRFRRVRFVAGPGANAGSAPALVSNHRAASPRGNSGTLTAAAASKTCQCPVTGQSVGGGAGSCAGGSGQAGSAQPATTLTGGGAGGSAVGSCRAGSDGARGNQASGGLAPQSDGRIDADHGWRPAAGGDGAFGSPGGGGGGGGCYMSTTSPCAGSGGGCGGCGGAAGRGGLGGGASIGLLVLESAVSLDACEIHASDGGRGGDGTGGQTGQLGGEGGALDGCTKGCEGGAGGTGASGGGGAGGTGGVSAGIVYTSAVPPVVDAVPLSTATSLASVSVGKGGEGGRPGDGGVTATGGIAGLAGSMGRTGASVAVLRLP